MCFGKNEKFPQKKRLKVLITYSHGFPVNINGEGLSAYVMNGSVKLQKMDKIQVLPSPTKSLNDVKNYKCIKLPNGLMALLVSDTSYDLDKLDQEENEID